MSCALTAWCPRTLGCPGRRTLRPPSPGGCSLSSPARPRRLCVARAAEAESTADSASTFVTEVDSEEQFDSLVAGSGSKLVVVDCSATWCGPCKMFKPTFAQFAEAYTEQTVFLSVMGDANASTAKLMKRLAVKAVPAFFFFKEGQQVASFTGANKTGFRNQLAAFIQI